MTWIVATLRAHPEVALFATLALGYALGRVRVGAVQLNPIIGVLVVGLLIGQVGVVVPDALKWAFFALFIFAIGYEIGPQFFRGLRAGVAKQVTLTLFFCAVSLALALVLAKLFHFPLGTAAGAYSGGLTQSAAIGTSVDAIARLPLDAATRQQLTNDVTIAYAVTYIAGLVASIWSVAHLAPRLLRVDLAAACRELEARLGVGADEAGVVSAYHAFVARAYDVPASLAGRSVAALEASFMPQRAFVERVRRGGEIVAAEPDTVLEAGDRVAVSAGHETLVANANPLCATEVDDAELLDIPTIEVEAVLTRRDLAGLTLGDIGRRLATEVATRGVFVAKLVRAGQSLPRALGTVLERGDLITLLGARTHVARIATRIGMVEWPGPTSDVLAVTATITLGALLGLLTVRIGGVEIGLSLAVGVLLTGLLVGWLRSVFPVRARVPPAGIWLLQSLGLTAFLAAVALNAGPGFVAGVRSTGPVLLASGFVLGSLPHVLSVLFGHYVLRIHPGLLLGMVAGAGSQPAILSALEDKTHSKVAALGYGVCYAISSVVLTLWGTVIVLVLAR
ncbi:MAG TPA: TrkA C-terminal domain-containing protein [Gammaproteobacteria bacterium]|nr:TrkA C-terminal domain-containing protein [Gammaproteobacteria bacterium]